MKWLFLLGLILLLPAAAGAAAPAPSLELTADRFLAIGSLPAAVLTDKAVQTQLTSGLTTSLVIRLEAVDSSRRKVKGGAAVDIRYELWDEVFLVAAVGADGQVTRARLPDLPRLLDWWRKLRLPVAAAGGLSPGGAWKAEVGLQVVPFSRSEQREVQRWFSDSLSRPAAPSPGGRRPEESPEAVGGVVDLLIATSIQRRSLVSYDWTLIFHPNPGHRP